MRRHFIISFGAALGLVALLPATPAAAATAPTTELVSISTGGQQGNDISGRFDGPSISGDGQVVAFDSIATTLVGGDTNNEADIFVRDRATDTTERVSVNSSGGQANDSSGRPALDNTGTIVAFDSNATNLVTGDTNQQSDVFVRNRATDKTIRVSVSSTGAQANATSHSPAISDDGRYVTFVSVASNLVSGDTNNAEDIFVRDLVAGTTQRVSLATGGGEANSSSTEPNISADGTWVTYNSFATNLVPGDSNGMFDVFVTNRLTGVTELVSVSSSEQQGDATSAGSSVSADGQLVAFWSDATTLVPNDTNDRRDVFVRNRTTGTTERVSVNSAEQQADGTSEEPGVRGFLASRPEITPDGRYVSFFSSATNLVSDDTNTCPLFFDQFPGECPDVFVRDRVAGTTERVNVAADGTQANDRSADPSISNDGQAVAFFSAANTLVPGDTNTCPLFTAFPGNCPDIFVHDRGGAGGGTDADLALAMTDSPDPVKVGRGVTYTVTVTNNGPASATAVVLTDTLPAGVRFVSATATAGTCTRVRQTVTCQLGTVPAGGSVQVTVKVKPATTGTITNTATVDAAEADPNAGNNTASATTTVTSR